MFLHTDAQLVEWQDGWFARFSEVIESDPHPDELVGFWEERADWQARHPCRRTIGTWKSSCVTPVPRWSGSVEDWRPLVSSYFGDQTSKAMCVLNAESRGNPRARNPKSGARGLFQIMGFWAPHFGVSADALYDPETNVRLARRILDIQGWRAWSPVKRGSC